MYDQSFQTDITQKTQLSLLSRVKKKSSTKFNEIALNCYQYCQEQKEKKPTNKSWKNHTSVHFQQGRIWLTDVHVQADGVCM